MERFVGFAAMVCAAALAGCATGPYYGARPYPPGTVYVERGADGEPVASATDRDIAAWSAAPVEVAPPVVAYRPPYGYSYSPPYYGPYAGPATSLYFSWNSARPAYPYRGWGPPPPRYVPGPVPPRAFGPPPPPRPFGPPPGVHAPPVGVRPPPAVGAPPAMVGRPPPGGYRGMFGQRIGPQR